MAPIKIKSGLGEAAPKNVIVLPVLFETEIKAVIELASFEHFTETQLDFLGQLTGSIGIMLNTIETNTRTEELLAQSQSLTDELRRTNEELQDKAHLLVKQKEEVEAKNKEVEEARKSLEEKAEQLQLTSKYKSEFLANMSHELRTPLMVLASSCELLLENPALDQRARLLHDHARHQHRRRIAQRADARDGLQAVDPGHGDIQQHHLAGRVTQRLEQLLAIAGLAHHLQAVDVGEHPRNACANQIVVVDHQLRGAGRLRLALRSRPGVHLRPG